MAFQRFVLLLALVAIAAQASSTPVPLSGLFQSNGNTCEAVPLDTCTPCGSQYYKCSVSDGRYSCFYTTSSACESGQFQVTLLDYCPTSQCNMAVLPNYQFEAYAASGIGLFHSGDSNVYGSVALNSTSITVVANDFEGIVVTSAAATDVLFMETGVYSDNTILTNKGFCPVGEWCTADSDLSYRVSLLSNTSYSAGDVHPDQGLELLVDTLSLLSTSEELDMTLYEERLYIPDDQVGALEVSLWPSGIKWTNFQLKQLYDDTEIIFEVNAGSDFSMYLAESCDDDDGLQSCHLDALFDFSGIISNPFIHPFFSFSFLFEEAEAPAEVAWDEQPTFNLFE